MSLEGQTSEQMHDTDSVLGIDNIALHLPLAGIGSRTLAITIDYAILTVLIPLVSLALFGTGLLGLEGPWLIVVFVVLLFLVYWGYFLLQEILLSGRTFGKMAVHLRVVGRHGGGASWTQLVLRNLLRPVDMMVGLPFMAVDDLSRRLGDRVAGTLVIHDRPQEAQDVSLGRIPAPWDARRVAIAESFLRRASGMDPARAQALATRLLRLIRQDDPLLLDGAPPPDTEPLAALRYALGVEES